MFGVVFLALNTGWYGTHRSQESGAYRKGCHFFLITKLNQSSLIIILFTFTIKDSSRLNYLGSIYHHPNIPGAHTNMIPLQRTFVTCSKSIRVPPSTKYNILPSQIRYSSSSSSSSSPTNDVQPQETNEIEQEQEEAVQANSGTTDSTTASPSTAQDTLDNNSLKTATTVQDHTKIDISKTIGYKETDIKSNTKSSKSSKSSTSKKTARSYRSTSINYNIPYVPSTQHLGFDRIYEDMFFQTYRPLLSPVKDLLKYTPSKSLTPKINNIAYWNTSITGQPLAPLDSVPKFIGDGMKAFKKPAPAGSEIRIYPREEELSADLKRFLKTEARKEREEQMLLQRARMRWEQF